jgi:polysaccharide biosynthesis transport protein
MPEITVGNAAPSRRRDRWLFWTSIALAVIFVALGGFGGLHVYRGLPSEYSASTTVLVLPTSSGLDSSVAGKGSTTEIEIDTEAQLLQSALVASDASNQLKGALSTKELLKNATVTVPPNSQILVVSLLANSPEKARDGSMALATAYLARRVAAAKEEAAGVVSALQSQQKDLNARLVKTTDAVAKTDSQDPQRPLLDAQKALLIAQISDVSSRLVALSVPPSTGGQIVTQAALPDKPASPNLPLTVGAGLIIGFLAAGGVLLAANQLRDKRSAMAGQSPTTRVPVLATLALSHSPSSNGAGGADAVRFVDEEEVLRRLCMKISTRKGLPGPTVLVGVGDPTLRTRVGTSLNRAWAAEFGSSVLVLTEEGDHSEVTGIAATAPGLRDALRRDKGILETAIVPVGTYAGVVGPGRDAHMGTTAAQRGLLSENWGVLEKEFATVLVQTGSPLDSPLAQSVAVTAGRFIVLVEVGIGQRRDLTSTLEEIEWLELSDRVAGVVIVSNQPAPAMTDSDLFPSSAEPHKPDVPGAFHDRD